MQSSPPRILIIAGPNGAGKTSFAREFLPNEAACPLFVNADLIAAGLSPFAPERAALQAARLMPELIATYVAARESFAFETTLSSRSYAKEIPQWQALGYQVELLFLGLPSVELAIERVAERAKQGGQSIAVAVQRKRFESGLHLFSTVYQALVDRWGGFDNSGDEPLLLDWGGRVAPPPKPLSPTERLFRLTEPLASDEADESLRGALAALSRAALNARLLARDTGTELVVLRSGRVVRFRP